MDCSPPGSSVHGDSPDKNTGVGCHALLSPLGAPTQFPGFREPIPGSELGSRSPRSVSGLRRGKGPPRGEPPPVTPTPAPPQPLQPDLYLLSLTEPAAVASEVTLFALAPQPASPARSRWKGK